MNQLPRDVADQLRALTDSIVEARQADPAGEFDPVDALAQAAPLFAILQAVNRESALFAKQCKDRTSAARLEMDRAHLRLQVRRSPRPPLDAHLLTATACAEPQV